MRPLLICALILPTIGVAQVTGEWKPSKESALQIARDADDRVRSARNLSVLTKFQIIHVNEGRGQGTYEGAFGPKGEFRIAYPVRTGPGMRAISQVETISDGKQYLLTGATVTTLKLFPVKTKKLIGKDLSASWFGDYPRLMWASLGSSEYPVSEAVRQLGAAGYLVSLDTRDVAFNGRTMKQYRIHIASSPTQSKAMGSRDWEMIIDGARKFPVKVNVDYKLKGKAEERAVLDIRWNLKAGQKFPADTFDLKPKKH